jgi:hypothetical protein
MLQHHQAFTFNFLVSGETMGAGDALASTADGRPFA